MRPFATVIFDCDSTLSAIEGVEELAHAQRAHVAALTEAAMRGEVALEDVYGQRLELVRPSRAQVEALGRHYVAALVPGAAELVAALHEAGIDVCIISGGLRPAVLELARALGIPAARVAAVDVHFDAQGNYAGFDAASPLTRAGGKRVVIEAWLPELRRPILLVGDGATDLEARPVVDLFVAYAGVIERAAVIEGADVVLRGVSLAPVLPLALAGVAPAEPAARALFEQGIHGLDSRYRIWEAR